MALCNLTKCSYELGRMEQIIAGAQENLITCYSIIINNQVEKFKAWTESV